MPHARSGPRVSIEAPPDSRTVPDSRAPAEAPGAWLWLFPASQAVHIGEEYWAGYGFHRWMARFSGAEVSEGYLLLLHWGFVLGMAAAVVLVRRSPRWSWLVPALAALVLANATAHVCGSLYLASYSSGLLSAVIVWLPLGSLALKRSWSDLPRPRFWLGVAAGLVIQWPITWLALNAGRLHGP